MTDPARSSLLVTDRSDAPAPPRTLAELAGAGYNVDEWHLWQQGYCAAYAAALQQADPALRIGALDDGSHFFAHDDSWAYDSAGRHPLPYRGVHGQRDADLDVELDDWGEPGDSAGPEGPEPHIRAALAHITRHRILAGRYGPRPS
jgi:hypothetical protein